MVDSVNITQVGGIKAPMWATEETQDRIKDLMQTGVQLDNTASEFRRKNAKNQKQGLIGLGNQFDKSMEKNNKWLSDTLARSIKGAIVGGASFETLIKRGLQSFGETLAKVPILGAVLIPVIISFKKLTEVVQIAVSGMVDLYDHGVSLNGSFINLMRVAGQSNIGLIELIDAVKAHSASITRMSTENNKGIAAFGELSLAVRENIRQYDYFGLTIAETNEILGEHLDSQMISGQIQQMERNRTAKAVGSYIKELTRLSLFTGKRRKQVQAEVEEVARKTSIAAVLAGMSDTAALQMKEMIAMGATLGPAAVQMVEDLILTGTTGLSETTAGVAALMPGVVKNFGGMIQSIKDGQTVSEETKARTIEQANREGKQLAQIHGKNLGYISTQNEAVAGGLSVALAAQTLTRENYQQQLEFKGAIDKFYIAWDHIKQQFFSRFMEIATVFLKILNDSGIIRGLFGTLKEGLEIFTGWLNDNVTEKKMNEGIEKFRKWWDDFDIENPFKSIVDTIENIFDGLAQKIVESFEYYIERSLNDMSPGGILGTSKSKEEWLLDRAHEENADLRRRLQLGFGTGGKTSRIESATKAKAQNVPFNKGFALHAKGGIARVPSMFGEAGPEVAIPLTSGLKIPVAEVKRSKKEMKTFDDIRSLLEDIKDRIEFTAQEAQTQNTTLKQIERKTGNDFSRIF